MINSTDNDDFDDKNSKDTMIHTSLLHHKANSLEFNQFRYYMYYYTKEVSKKVCMDIIYIGHDLYCFIDVLSFTTL